MAASIGQRLRHIIGDQFGASVVEFNLEKAVKAAQDKASEKAGDPTSTFYDPMSLFMGREWLDRANKPLSFRELRVMARNPIIGSIIQTRVNQMATFMRPQTSYYEPGFIFRNKDDKVAKTKDKAALEEWLMGCGIPGYGEESLEILARKWCRDTLTMDQTAIEVVPRKNKEPAYMVAVDAATIRLLKSALDYATPPNSKDPLYVQIIQDQIVTEYTHEQLIFGIRNPQTDIEAQGYGFSELELLIRIVTTMINAERYNAGQLTQGGTQKGILVVKGQNDNVQMESFKRDFREALRNASAYWRAPVLNISKDAQVDWVRLDNSARDMEYSQLFDFLVKQACGVYQIDPAEINWTIGASGSQTTFQARQKDNLMHSQQKGLAPLLNSFAAQLNRPLSLINEEYRLCFVGVGTDREAEGIMRDKEVRSYKTLNEQRAELGMAALAEGDTVLDGSYIGVLESAKFDKQQAEREAAAAAEPQVEESGEDTEAFAPSEEETELLKALRKSKRVSRETRRIKRPVRIDTGR